MTAARGPDFLPYPLPNRTVAPATAVMPQDELPAGGRWQRALDGLTPWGVAALTAAGCALVSLILLSLITGHRNAGAILSSVAGIVSLGAGIRARKDDQPEDSVTLVKGGMGTGVLSGIVALLLLLSHHSSVAEQPPVQIPSPQPTVTTAPGPQPTPSTTPQPQSSPSLGVLPPGSADLFGVPTEPDLPLSEASTDKGLLTGRVVTTSGAGLQGAKVTVTRADPTDVSDSRQCPLKLTATTDARGNYRVELCQLGTNLGYHVVITSGSERATTDLYVNAGRTTVYNVILAVRHA